MFFFVKFIYRDFMNYLNTCAINDSKFAVNFAYLVSSKVFDTFNTNQLDVRRKMLNILQYNFISKFILIY